MHYLLMVRLLVVNIVFAAGLYVAVVEGWVERVWYGDTSYISHGIAVVFLYGLYRVFSTAYLITRGLFDAPNADPLTRPRLAGITKHRLTARLATVNEVCSFLVMMGLVGTVLGFIQAMASVSTTAVSDPAATINMIVAMIHGMDVALYTTLVGSVSYLWLRTGYRIVANGATKLISQLER